MGAIASQITSLMIIYSIINSGADQRKYQSSASPVSSEFPAQMASNTENAYIWWRHHGMPCYEISTNVCTMFENWMKQRSTKSNLAKWISLVEYIEMKIC